MGQVIPFRLMTCCWPLAYFKAINPNSHFFLLRLNENIIIFFILREHVSIIIVSVLIFILKLVRLSINVTEFAVI